MSRMSIPRIGLTLFLVALPTLGAVAADLPEAQLPPASVQSIVDKCVAARGGLTAWHAVRTMSWIGTMGAGGTTYETVSPRGALEHKQHEEAQLPFVFEYKRSNKTRLELRFNGQTAVQVFDGANGYKLRPYLGRADWEPYTAEERRQAAAATGIDGLLIDYATKGSRVELAGTEMVEGHAAYKLAVTLKDAQVRHVWVDGQSYLDVKMEGEPRKLDGRMHPVFVYQRDFKRDGAVLVPHTLETAVQGVPKTEKISIDTVTLNPSLDDARFTKSQ